jgi:glutamate racemase
MAIGICDWGIGGIGLHKLIRKKSNVDIVYFSDSGFTPYGKVPVEELRERMKKVIDYFNSLGIEQIAVACNAASTVIPIDKNITGIIEHGVKMVTEIHPEKIVVAGGIRIIESNIYKTAFEKNGIATIQRIAQPLSARIEAGEIASEELDNEIQEIFEPVKNEKHILLACTHYPVISTKINAFAKQATLLDPAEEMAEWIFSNWENLQGNSSTRWLTTGDSKQMKISASKSFGVEINEIENIQL